MCIYRDFEGLASKVRGSTQTTTSEYRAGSKCFDQNLPVTIPAKQKGKSKNEETKTTTPVPQEQKKRKAPKSSGEKKKRRPPKKVKVAEGEGESSESNDAKMDDYRGRSCTTGTPLNPSRSPFIDPPT